MKTHREESPAARAEPAALPAQARWAIASLSLSMLLSALGTSIANVGLPTLVQAFGAPFAQVQWVVLAYLLAITTVIVSVGRLGDLFGRRRLLLAGIGVFSAASVLCALAPSLAWLVAARALQGVGAAVMMALTMAFVGDTVPKARTGSAMGLLGTMSAVGTAMGPSLGGLLIAGWGWPALFLVNLPLGLLAVVLAWRYLPADPVGARGRGAGFDPLGTVLLALALAAYALAMTAGSGRFGPLNLGLLLAAAVAGWWFVRTQARVASPLVPLAHFRDPALGAGFAMSALVTTVVMATMVVGPFYLSQALALDAVRVGLAMSCGPLAAALTGFPAGRLVDRLGSHRVTLAGLAAMAGGAVLMVLAPQAMGVAGYVVPLMIITSGYAAFQTANNTTVMGRVGAEHRGVVSGLLNLSRNLGLITGASVMGAVYSFGVATAASTLRSGAVAFGMRLTFGVAAMLALVSLLIASVAWHRARGSSLRDAAAAVAATAGGSRP